MKNSVKYLSSGILIMLLVVMMAFNGSDRPNDPLAIGEKAPLTDVELKDVSGESIALNEIRGPNGLLVIFSCNTCPWVKKWEDRYNPIAMQAKQRGIGMIALNPNEGFRDNGDSFEDMVARAKEKQYKFFYALDENHKLADAYGATKTPEVFLFNKELELVYHGAIDDNANSAENVEKPYLKNALSDMVNEQEVEPKTTKSLGCSIKRTE